MSDDDWVAFEIEDDDEVGSYADDSDTDGDDPSLDAALEAARAEFGDFDKELAELKRDQILGYGRDPQVSCSSGSMNAVIEPATEEKK